MGSRSDLLRDSDDCRSGRPPKSGFAEVVERSLQSYSDSRFHLAWTQLCLKTLEMK